jgi:hypothetical protein
MVKKTRIYAIYRVEEVGAKKKVAKESSDKDERVEGRGGGRGQVEGRERWFYKQSQSI